MRPSRTCRSTWANSMSCVNCSRLSSCLSVRSRSVSWCFFFLRSSLARLKYNVAHLHSYWWSWSISLRGLCRVRVLFLRFTSLWWFAYSFFPSSKSFLANNLSFSITALTRFWYFFSSSLCFFNFWRSIQTNGLNYNTKGVLNGLILSSSPKQLRRPQWSSKTSFSLFPSIPPCRFLNLTR